MYNRKITKEILKKLEIDNKAIILVWPRQVWKTTIMKNIYSKLKGWEFIDLDSLSNREIFLDENSLIFYLKSKWYSKDKEDTFYLFVDEFQNVKNSTIIFKSIIDNYKNIKIIASWSSSLSIKNLIKESLVWRAYVFNIWPLDFKEFLEFKKEDEVLNYIKEDNLPKFARSKIDSLLKEFIIFWWYPEVVLNDKIDDKYSILESIFEFYLQKDIRDILNIKNISNYNKLLRYIAINIWNLQKVNSIWNDLWINNITLNNYLSILEDTFIIWRLEPYFSNKINSIKKSPKIYMLDNWLRNYLLKNFSELDLRVDKWGLVENYVYWEFIKNKSKISNLFFWRDKNGNEIDFIIEQNGKLDLYEVKSNNSDKINTNAIKIIEKNSIVNSKNILSFSDWKKMSDIKHKYLFNI